MNTLIRKGQSIFFDDINFPYGISRSGHFNRKESEDLAVYGRTFEALQSGKIAPENEDEIKFVKAISANQESSDYYVKLWKKYINIIEKSRIYYGFSTSSEKLTDAVPDELTMDELETET